jgi:hypothetical protein
MTLTTADILAGYDNDEWMGFGYLGERRNAQDTSDPEATPATPERIAAVDALILDAANAQGWDRARLFQWSNSRAARHWADQVIWDASVDIVRAQAGIR